MTKKDDEEKKTWAALVGKIAVAVLGAMAAGGAGSVALAPAAVDDEGLKDRVSQLEHACSSYNVRLATTEAKLQNYESNLVEVRKDLAEIRSTNTQILFILQKDK